MSVALLGRNNVTMFFRAKAGIEGRLIVISSATNVLDYLTLHEPESDIPCMLLAPVAEDLTVDPSASLINKLHSDVNVILLANGVI